MTTRRRPKVYVVRLSKAELEAVRMSVSRLLHGIPVPPSVLNTLRTVQQKLELERIEE